MSKVGFANKLGGKPSTTQQPKPLTAIEAAVSKIPTSMRGWAMMVLQGRTREADKAGYSEKSLPDYQYKRKATYEDGSVANLYFRNEAQSEKLLGPTAATIKRQADDASFAKDDAIRKKRGASGDIFTTPLGQVGSRAAANALLG